MKKFFNTTGPCFPERHYMVDPLKRLKGVEALIDQGPYFVIHAPRQSGKTTFGLAVLSLVCPERVGRVSTRHTALIYRLMLRKACSRLPPLPRTAVFHVNGFRLAP